MVDDEWCDPIWRVELIDGEPRELRSCWIHGPSYSMTGAKTDGGWEPAERSP
jgi:hypothetical protein